jgi:hypothetical protein
MFLAGLYCRRCQNGASSCSIKAKSRIREELMIDRRAFATLLAGAIAAPRLSWGEDLKGKTVLYASIGPALTLYDLDGDALVKRSTVTLPANIQYAWPHPSRKYFYIVSSNGGPGAAGD